MDRKQLGICLVSLVVGCLLATCQDALWERSATAQTDVAPVVDRFRPRLPASNIIPPPSRTSSELSGSTTWQANSTDDSFTEEDWTPEERVNIAVYEKANRSVVNVTTRTVRPDSMFIVEVAEGSGSGFVIDTQGNVLTNLHVIEGAREVKITLYNGETLEANLVGQDPVNDIAVLHVDCDPQWLYPVEFGQSNRLRVGQRIYAIGNPFGLERTLTTGIISSLNRTLPSRNERQMKSIIQIDAALNRGNSGGPLLNGKGQLIGMNAAIASNTGQNTGVGFAIPANTIERVVPQIIANGQVIRPETGITVLITDRGLVVAQLMPGGPGERAGLRGFRVIQEQRQRGQFVYTRTALDQSNADIILAVDSQTVTDRDEFLTAVEQKQPGESVTLTVERDGQPIDVTLELSWPQ